MQYLKQKFITLSIRKQVQIGICAVTSCVFILVFTLMIISTFVMVNIIYTDMSNSIEHSESNEIAEIMNYIEIAVSETIDFSKIATQWTRNYHKNIKKYSSFSSNIISKNLERLIDSETNTQETDEEAYKRYVSSFFYIIKNGDTQQIKNHNKNFTNDNNKQVFDLNRAVLFQLSDNNTVEVLSSDLARSTINKYTKILLMAKNIYNFRIYNLLDKIVSNISIINLKDGLIFIYPAGLINSEFNYQDFVTRLFYYYAAANYTYSNNLQGDLSIFNKVGEFDYIENMKSNPFVNNVDGKQGGFDEANSVPFINSNDKETQLVDTISFNISSSVYNENLNISSSFASYSKNITAFLEDTQEIVINHWDLNSINELVEYVAKKFTGSTILVSNRRDMKIYTTISCYRFIKFFDFANNLNGNYSVINQMYNGYIKLPEYESDCIIYPLGKQQYTEYFNNTLSSINRARVVNAVNEKYDNNEKVYIYANNTYTNSNGEEKYNIIPAKEVFINIGNSSLDLTSNNLFTDFSNFVFPTKKTSKRFKYKVYKSLIPSKTVFSLHKSLFIKSTAINLVLLKEQRQIETDYSLIYEVFNGIMYFIVFYNLLLWVVTITIIIFILNKITDDITKPINDLIVCIMQMNSGKSQNTLSSENMLNNYTKTNNNTNNNNNNTNTNTENNKQTIATKNNNIHNTNDSNKNQVDDKNKISNPAISKLQDKNKNSINNNNNNSNSPANMGNSKSQKKLSLENINFPDDSTINDFFSTCKNLIKGGFNEDKQFKNNNFKYNDLFDMENFNKLVKFNNYIIQDNLILNSFSNKAASIFTYIDNRIQSKNQNDYIHMINFSSLSNNNSINSETKNHNPRLGTNANTYTHSSDVDNSIGNSVTNNKDNQNTRSANKKFLKMFDNECYEPNGYFSVKGIIFMKEIKEVINVVKAHKKMKYDENILSRNIPELLNDMFNLYTNNGLELKKNVDNNK